MRTDFRRLSPASSPQDIEAQAWVVLEMHFLSRPHLLAEARERLQASIAALRAEGIADPRTLKDRACRKVQMQYGPAPAFNDDTLPVATYVA